MSNAVVVTAIICATLVIVSIINKIPTKKSTSYFYKDDKIMGVKDEYK